MSLDPKIDRSFAADPLKDPFALDRARFPIGTAFFNPRQFIYYVAPAEPTGKWRCVITLIEDRSLEVFKNSPNDMVNQLSDSFVLQQKTARRPDWLRIELELSDAFVDYLKKNNFRVFPFDLLKTLKGKYAAQARKALKNIPIAPVEFFQEIRQIVVSSVDWNAPLAPIEFALHILKHRNTVAAGMNKVFAQFGIKLHAAGELLFMMRDILVANEQMATIVNGNSTNPIETNKLMGAGVRDAEELRQVQEALQQVRETRTFFKQPVTYVTFRFRALIEASTGAIRFAEKVASNFPPKARNKVREWPVCKRKSCSKSSPTDSTCNRSSASSKRSANRSSGFFPPSSRAC